MEDLTSKILNLLKEEGVKITEIRPKLSFIIDDIEKRLWEKISISLPLLYNLKDTVWYNLEHLPNGGKEKGLDDLRFMGTKYPTLMFSANDDVYIKYEKLESLLAELEDILSKWSNDWTFVQLMTKSMDGWNAGLKDPSPVIIYDPNKGERLSKYGYYSNQAPFAIFDKKGDYIYLEKRETVLCAIETKLGIYGREPMMRALLEKLINTCKKAIKSGKGIMLNVNYYDYTS